MSKILVYIYEGMADFEISLLIHLLGVDCGKELVVVSNSLKTIQNKAGISFNPSKKLNQVIDEEVEGIIIPGGWLENLDEDLIRLIKKLNENNKLVAAICAAPWILAKAGVLNNRKYTTTIEKWDKKYIELFRTDDPFPWEGYMNERVVRDGNVITAKGLAFVDFAVEVCDYLNLFEDEIEKKTFEREVKGN
ncbi:type 1 glutamine amidotransferase family protein [Vallitalea sediminicola]